jgi:dipeptidyl-peptidase-4
MKSTLLLAGLVLFAASTMAQSNVQTSQQDAAQGTKMITLEDIWQNHTFAPQGIAGIRSMADGEHYCVLTRTGIEKYSYETGKKEGDVCLFNVQPGKYKTISKEKPMPPVESYEFDKKEEQLLLSTGFEPIYRHSGVSDYYVYNIANGTMKKVSQNGKQRLTTFSPDGKMLAFVRDNNLYIYDIAKDEEHQITTDGKMNSIINGTTDWVYEEEFAITQGFYWSPDSKKIAFYRFDESNVKEYTMQMWGGLYPQEYKYKYPKAGEDNSVVDVLIYDMPSGKTMKLNIGSENDQYIPRLQWTKDDNTLCVMRMNRLQNHLELLLADASTGDLKTLYTEDDKAYVEVPTTFEFLKDGKHFLLNSEKSGYNHLYLYDMKGKLVRQVTTGNYDVAAVCGIDEENEKIYYTSHESSPINTDLYCIDFKGKHKVNLGAQRQGTYDAVFSEGCKYFIQDFSDANSAPVYTLRDSKGNVVNVLQDNAALQKTMNEYGAGHKQFGQLTTDEGVTVNYYLITPGDFDSTEAKRYPVLVYVYGGPGNQQVTNGYGYSDYYWYHMLAQKGYVVLCFDGRGTGGRGAEWKKMTYKNLGHYECMDAIAVGRWLGKKKWVDADRIGIWGWSFGGYLSSLTILKGHDVFKTAIAVAPVTTWRYYDNIYTERFLQRPQDNPAGYDENSPINFANLLEGNFLLVHGTGDDNVHLQNSLDLVTALEGANKQFEFRLYPNKNHSIYGGNTRLNLYQLMTDFLLRKL